MTRGVHLNSPSGRTIMTARADQSARPPGPWTQRIPFMVTDTSAHAPLPPVQTNVPLCVDLDGTLVSTDTLYECLLLLIAKNPLYLFVLPLWLWRGKAFLKREICRRVELDVTRLPYHAELLDRLQKEHRAGRPIVLVTAADRSVARKVAEHLGLFSEVFASDGLTNLSGRRKLDLLVRRFGARGFDYAGNAAPDLHIWREANKAIIVCASGRLLRNAAGRLLRRERSGVRLRAPGANCGGDCAATSG